MTDLLQSILLAAIWCWLGYSVGRDRKRPESTLEKFGRCIGESVVEVYDARKFIGPGVSASATHTIRLGDGREIKIIVREDA